jgi:hypothetical protein
MAVDALSSEPRSAQNSLFNRELTGNFVDFEAPCTIQAGNTPVNTVTCREIPHSKNRELFGDNGAVSGNIFGEQGFFGLLWQHSDRRKALHGIRKFLNQLDQQGRLRIGFGAALFPIFQRPHVGT